MLESMDASAEIHLLTQRLEEMTRGTADYERSGSTGKRFVFAVLPRRANAAPIVVSFDDDDGLLEARFGSHTTSREWVESREELALACANILELSSAVVAGRFEERAWYSGEQMLRASACMGLGDDKTRRIVDGGVWRSILSLVKASSLVEKKYAPYS